MFGGCSHLVGVFHALLARDMREKKDVALVAVMGLVTLFYKNLTLALCAGLLLREVLRYRVYYERLFTLKTVIFARGEKQEMTIPYGYRDRETAIPERRVQDYYSRKVAELRVAVTAARHLNPLYDVPKPAPQQASAREFLSA